MAARSTRSGSDDDLAASSHSAKSFCAMATTFCTEYVPVRTRMRKSRSAFLAD